MILPAKRASDLPSSVTDQIRLTRSPRSMRRTGQFSAFFACSALNGLDHQLDLFTTSFGVQGI
jgi:hypothetical protein